MAMWVTLHKKHQPWANDVFLKGQSLAVNAVDDMKMMQKRLQEALRADGKDEDTIKERLKTFHFARDPMSGIYSSIMDTLQS